MTLIIIYRIDCNCAPVTPHLSPQPPDGGTSVSACSSGAWGILGTPRPSPPAPLAGTSPTEHTVIEQNLQVPIRKPDLKPMTTVSEL